MDINESERETGRNEDDSSDECRGMFERFHDKLVGEGTAERGAATVSSSSAENGGDPRTNREDDVKARDQPPRGTEESSPEVDPRTGLTGVATAGTGVLEAKNNGRQPGIASALVRELTTGQVDEETRDALREQLGRKPSASESVRLDRRDVRVSTLEAYKDELESIFDEVGSAEEIAAELESLRDTIEALEEEMIIEGDLEAFEEVDGIRENIAALEEDVEELIEWKETLDSAFDST